MTAPTPDLRAAFETAFDVPFGDDAHDDSHADGDDWDPGFGDDWQQGLDRYEAHLDRMRGSAA